MRETAFVSHYDCSRHDTGWNHPDHQGRLPGLMRAVHADMLTLFDSLLEVEGRHASPEELLLVHSEAYLAQVEGWVAEAARLGKVIEPVPGIRVSGASMDAARAAVGCTLTAVDRILADEVQRAFCAVRPPGRYVTRDAPGSFGLYNTVATCADYLGRAVRAQQGADSRGLFVLEIGGPGGSPTAHLLKDKAVHVAGVYLAGSGPPAGEHERHLGKGAGSRAFLEAVDQLLEKGSDVKYAALVLSIGFDGLAGDHSGDLALQPVDYHSVTRRLRHFAEEQCDGRIVSVLEGGSDARGLGIAAVQHLRALVGVDPIG